MYNLNSPHYCLDYGVHFNLYFLAWGKFKAIELLWILLDQRGGEALDAVVAGAKAELIHQILVDGGDVAM